MARNNDLGDYVVRNVSIELAVKSVYAGKPRRIKVSCPKCEKIGDAGAMKRWHFDNCKDRSRQHTPHAETPFLTCDRCGMSGRAGAMRRWHFENCVSC
jgi:hypothetical protein